MKLAFAVVATMTWMGCAMDAAMPTPGEGDPVDPGPPGSGDSGDPVDPGPGAGPVTEVSGHITAATTWAGAVHVVDNVTIDPGATVTVMPGATVSVNAGMGITVWGTLDIQGTKAERVTFRSADMGEFWNEIIVSRTGVLTARYLVQTSGGLNIVGPGQATIVDSQFSHYLGDLLTMTSGTLDMTYSAIGLPAGRDITHCNMHVRNAPIIRMTHSNISAASWGVMFYGGTDADFTHNNWFGNSIDIATVAGTPVTGDFSGGYFAKGAPALAGITATNLATSMIVDAGVR